MHDYLASIERLRTDAVEAALIRDLATDHAKREMFDRLSQHLSRLADEVENAMNSPTRAPTFYSGDLSPAYNSGLTNNDSHP